MSYADDNDISTESSYSMDLSERGREQSAAEDRSLEATATFSDETFLSEDVFDIKHVSVHLQNVSENIAVWTESQTTTEFAKILTHSLMPLEK